MRTVIAALAIAALGSTAAFAQSVGGTYDVKGTNFDGSAYSGTAKITPSSNSTCRIEWQTGGTSSSGFCMLAGSSLAAAYKLNDSVGLVLYELQSDGSMKGVWTIADKSGAGTENLTPAK
ncbi:MAG TPA: hypothetical protein VHW90_09605 [Stellaceae bacterium]|jgi:hypothetical protein|nr:hypothetical protein [Stellaceae bacterium]